MKVSKGASHPFSGYKILVYKQACNAIFYIRKAPAVLLTLSVLKVGTHYEKLIFYLSQKWTFTCIMQIFREQDFYLPYARLSIMNEILLAIDKLFVMIKAVACCM
jgi:hypothetical protein